MPTKLVPIGIIFVFLGVLLIVIGSLFSTFRGKTDMKSAGVVFIGPIPLGWASDRQTFYTLLAFAVVILDLWFFFIRK